MGTVLQVFNRRSLIARQSVATTASLKASKHCFKLKQCFDSVASLYPTHIMSAVASLYPTHIMSAVASLYPTHIMSPACEEKTARRNIALVRTYNGGLKLVVSNSSAVVVGCAPIDVHFEVRKVMLLLWRKLHNVKRWNKAVRQIPRGSSSLIIKYSDYFVDSARLG
jgi:hypothetical protein